MGRTKRKKWKRNALSLRKMWDIIKNIDICIMGVPEREESKKGTTTIQFKEIMLKTSQIS